MKNNNLQNKNILVTGAKGMLGQDLCPMLAEKYNNVIKTDIDNLDFTDEKETLKFISEHKPDIIIHCGAYTNVDKAETEKEKAELINSKGVENIVNASLKVNSELVYISTDYVFDGNHNSPYKTSDKPNPINHYGYTKLLGENYIKNNHKKYYIVRTSWLYGINGKNFVETMLSLANKPDLKVVDDQTGCPTWTVELSKGIINLLNTGEYGTYHICGSGETTWFNFAKKIFELAGIESNVVSCKTEEFIRPAKRPKYSVMDNNNSCRYWQEALLDYINLRSKRIKEGKI